MNFLGLVSAEVDLHLCAIKFVEMVKQNPEVVEDKLRDFISFSLQRVERGEIKPITIRNYIKAVKVSRLIEWPLISKGIPSARR